MGIALRKAEPSDREAVRRLYRACVELGDTCWYEEYPNDAVIDEDIAMGALYLYGGGTEALGAVSLLPFDDVEEIGLAFRFADRPCVLCRLCVAPSRRHKGEGRGLLEAAERKAAGLGYRAVHLLCDKRNASANRLYRVAGYREAGEAGMYGLCFLAYEKQLAE